MVIYVKINSNYHDYNDTPIELINAGNLTTIRAMAYRAWCLPWKDYVYNQEQRDIYKYLVVWSINDCVLVKAYCIRAIAVDDDKKPCPNGLVRTRFCLADVTPDCEAQIILVCNPHIPNNDIPSGLLPGVIINPAICSCDLINIPLKDRSSLITENGYC